MWEILNDIPLKPRVILRINSNNLAQTLTLLRGAITFQNFRNLYLRCGIPSFVCTSPTARARSVRENAGRMPLGSSRGHARWRDNNGPVTLMECPNRVSFRVAIPPSFDPQLGVGVARGGHENASYLRNLQHSDTPVHVRPSHSTRMPIYSQNALPR